MWVDLSTEKNERIKYPLIFIPDILGSIGSFLVIAEEIQKIAPDRPVIALNSPFLANKNEKPPASVEELAKIFVDEILLKHESPVYFLCGYSFGGILVFEISKQLKAKDKKILFSGMIDTDLEKTLDIKDIEKAGELLINMVSTIAKSLTMDLDFKIQLPKQSNSVASMIEDVFSQLANNLEIKHGNDFLYKKMMIETAKQNFLLISKYIPSGKIDKITIFSANDEYHTKKLLGWDSYAETHSKILVNGDHFSVLKDKENIIYLAKALNNQVFFAETINIMSNMSQIIEDVNLTIAPYIDNFDLDKSVLNQYLDIPNVIKKMTEMMKNKNLGPCIEKNDEIGNKFKI